MKIQKMFSISGIVITLLLISGIRGVLATPEWLPANTDIAGYELQWETEMEFPDFTQMGDDENTTFYAQLWLKNDTALTNLLAAGMLSKGGALFSESAQISGGPTAETIKTQILAALGINETEYAALETIWDVLVLAMQKNLGVGYTVNETTVTNMDKAMVITDNANITGFDYLLFGYVGDRVLITFAFTTQTIWINYLANITLYNQTVYDLFQVTFYFTVLGFLSLFITFGALFATLGSLPFAPELHTAPSIRSSSITPQDTVYDEMTAFAAAWGQIAAEKPIPGYGPILVALVSMAAFATVAIRVKKRK